MAGAKSKLPIIAALAAALGALFFWRVLTYKQPIVDIRGFAEPYGTDLTPGVSRLIGQAWGTWEAFEGVSRPSPQLIRAA